VGGKEVYMSDYPECDRMNAVKEKSQVIGEFIEWLQSSQEVTEEHESIILAHYPRSRISSDPRLQRFQYTIEELLAKYFNIDLDKVEKEKRAILEALRKTREEEADEQ
jgi:septum formation topological specificity factor MinE